jgi:hypothetical protein
MSNSSKYSKAARWLKLQIVVHPDDEELHRLVITGSNLHKIMVDGCGLPVTQEMFDAIVDIFEETLRLNVLFQSWDLQIFNEWKVSAHLLEEYLRDAAPDDDLRVAVQDWL